MIWSFRTNGNYVDFVHTDETDLHEEILVHRLHNTSRCIDWSLPVDTTRISFTIDETRYENVSIYDIDFDGATMNEQADFETGIEAMFPGLAGGSGGGVESVTAGDASITVGGTATNPTVKLPYKVYTALVTQTETNAPTSTVLQNTLGFDLIWSRNALGNYWIHKSPTFIEGTFPIGKTWGIAGGGSNDVVEAGYMKFSEGGSEYWILYTFDVDGILSDDILVLSSIEIRVYP